MSINLKLVINSALRAAVTAAAVAAFTTSGAEAVSAQPVPCPDGSTVPFGQFCPPVIPPVPCSDGSTVPFGQFCPLPPPAPLLCPDGSTVPFGQFCPLALFP